MAALPDFCLIAGLLLSLVLPLYASARLRPLPPTRRPRIAAVWAGQSCLAAAGVLIVATNVPPAVSLGVGVLGWGACGLVFRRQLAGG